MPDVTAVKHAMSEPDLVDAPRNIMGHDDRQIFAGYGPLELFKG